MGYRTIVIGTDGSETANRALDRGIRFASRVGARIIPVCASAPVGMTDTAAEKVLDAASERIEGAELEAQPVLREGAPGDVILAVAREQAADMVVVGNVGMGKARRIRLGPIPERVAREGPCDVLIAYTKTERDVEDNPERIYDRIVVGTDGSATATEAARKAFDLGMMLGIGVTLVYVAGDPLVGAIHLERTAKAKPRALGVKERLVEGDPAEQIVAVAGEENAGLIVVGNKGMRGARRALLGSVPAEVAHRATGDVLIAKTIDRTADDLVPGTGGVVDVNGRKLAVYRREDGSLFALSPRCQHMGCTVDWNAADATWDCPCHGSRYSKEGDVIQGPSEGPLEPADL